MSSSHVETLDQPHVLQACNRWNDGSLSLPWIASRVRMVPYLTGKVRQAVGERWVGTCVCVCVCVAATRTDCWSS